jgi:hypothetical protein
MKYLLPTNDNSVSVTPNAAKITSFASTLPNYKEVLRAPFRQWAENALPGEYTLGLLKLIFIRHL